MQTSIDEDVRRLVTELSEARRDPMTFVIGLVMFLVGAVGGVGAWWLDSWWWRVPVWGVASVLVLVGLFGMWMGGQHARRDEKGNPIPNDADSAADSAGGSELEATQAAQDRPEVDDRS